MLVSADRLIGAPSRRVSVDLGARDLNDLAGGQQCGAQIAGAGPQGHASRSVCESDLEHKARSDSQRICQRRSASRRTAWKIAREHGWETTFDAEYLAVCKLQADALITIDQALAAKAAHIVPLATVAALSED